MKRKFLVTTALIAGLSLFLLALPVVTHSQLKVTISKYQLKNYALAIPDFLGDKLGKKIASIIRNDFELTGMFKVIPPASYLEKPPKNGIEPGTFDFSPWQNIGAQGLIKGSVERGAGGQLKIKFRFYEVGSGKLGVREEFTLTGSQTKFIRWYSHLISEKVYRYLTKEPGIFTTKIACIRIYRGKHELWVMDFDGHNARQLTNDGAIKVLPDWSPDGRYIAFTSWKAHNPDIYIFDTQTGQAKKISRFEGLNTGAAWSPDGRYIAFSASKGQEGMDIYVMNRDGSNIRRLTNSKNWIRNLSPTWSPDGKKIAFVSTRYAHPQIFVMNSDGSNQKQLTFKGKYNQAPKWSPKGDWILFTGRDERNIFDIFKISPKTGEIVRLTQNSGNNIESDWSPNGRNIVFTSDRSGVPKLFIMSADGKFSRQITFMPGKFQTPSWSPPFYR